MALTINKVLKGAIIQDVSANFNYILPETGINSVQNAISSSNFEEVFIDCFSDLGGQTILLPKISLFRRGFSPKIYVCNKGASNVPIFAYNNEDETNTVNFTNSWTLLPSQSGYLHIVNNGNWALWVTPIPAP